jgi:hypothetical protein
MGIEVRVQSSYFASLLIASGLDVKVVRHASAKTTLDTCHLWPDEDESYRAALYAVQALAEGGRGASGSA